MQQLISSILAMGIISVCDQCGETFKAYESDVSDSWDDYNTQLQEELGTTTLINGGYRYYFIIESITPSTDSMTVINAGTVGSYLISATYTASYTTRAIKYIFRPFTTSIPGYITGGYVRTTDNVNLYVSPVNRLAENVIAVPGKNYSWSGAASGDVELDFRVSDTSKFASFFGYLYVDFVPYQGAVGDYYDIDISVNTRPTTLIGSIGYYEGDTLQVIQNTTVVNETNNTYLIP